MMAMMFLTQISRGGGYNNGASAGVFNYYTYYGTSAYYSTRFVITNE